MSARVLHPEALFTPTKGQSRTVTSKELADPTVREGLRDGVLTDPDEQLQFFVRPSSVGTFHFYTRSETGDAAPRLRTKPEEPKDRDPSHDNAIAELLSYLKGEIIPEGRSRGDLPCAVDAEKRTLPAVDIVTRYFFDDPARTGERLSHDELLARLRAEDYIWQKEVNRFVGMQGLVRHDLFGHPTNPSMSVRRPNVAIEVIHSNPPSYQTLELMFEATRTSTLIVLFFFVVSGRRLFNCTRTPSGIEIRSAWFMLDGVICANERVVAKWDDPAAHTTFLRQFKNLVAKEKANNEGKK